MTIEEQNKAICKAIGQEYHKPTEAEISGGSYYQYEPDFTRDLNLIQGAVKTLSEGKRGYYNAELSKIAVNRPLSSTVKEPEFIFRFVNATAAQRAEAFLRCIGKWIDKPYYPVSISDPPNEP